MEPVKARFVGISIIVVGLVISLVVIVRSRQQSETKPSAEGLEEARFYEQLDDGKIRCNLCPNRCLLAEGQRGLCKVRENVEGKLYSLVYGKPVSIQVDPIEKKPLYHFLPGSRVYSLATAGCNLECKYCQNWDIAQRFPEDLDYRSLSPEEVVTEALISRAEVIAFTYNEPTVWYEYMFDIAKLAQERGLKTVVVSSGYINPEPLRELLPYIDAYKIDLKSFNSEVYAQLIRGELEPVLEAIKIVRESGTWLELVHLVVPGYTDDMEEIEEMCLWIKENVGEDTPVHFSRFWPRYKLPNLPPTSEEVVKQARQTCLEAGMRYVYTGNIADEVGRNTYCPDNQKPLIKRVGFSVQERLIDSEGRSADCATPIPGRWH